jgi:hypothetical protein
MRQHRRLEDDDDSPFDKRGVLKDGRSIRTPMFLMDTTQRAIATHLHDGHGNRDLVGHRPGHVVSDASNANDARDAAYRLYDEQLTNAWRTGGVEGREGAENSICTVRNAQYPRAQGAPGHVRNGICVPDDEELRDALPTRDSNMADVYAAYDARIREMWRNP